MDERQVTDCFICGGETARQMVTAEHWWGDDMMLFEHVPADVCRQCGERYYGAEVALRMDRLHRQPPSTGRTVAIRIYDLAAEAA